MMNNKIILIDFGIFLHRSIFSYYAQLGKSSYVPPPEYTCLSMIISSLKKIGVKKDDKIILAVDSKYGSWRKNFDFSYKKDRKEKRDKSPIDWKTMYKRMNKFVKLLDEATPFHIIRLKKMEADDIMAYSTKFYKDKECILISYDSDFEQLLLRDNVKIFSPHPKAKNCPYKILDLDRQKEIAKAYKSLAKKIKKEVSDGLVSDLLTEQDFEKRESIVSLLSLPKFVEEKVIEELLELTPKSEDEYDINELPFSSIRNRFNDIYSDKNVITYEKCREKFEKKLNKKKKVRRKKNECVRKS